MFVSELPKRHAWNKRCAMHDFANEIPADTSSANSDACANDTSFVTWSNQICLIQFRSMTWSFTWYTLTSLFETIAAYGFPARIVCKQLSSAFRRVQNEAVSMDGGVISVLFAWMRADVGCLDTALLVITWNKSSVTDWCCVFFKPKWKIWQNR